MKSEILCLVLIFLVFLSFGGGFGGGDLGGGVLGGGVGRYDSNNTLDIGDFKEKLGQEFNFRKVVSELRNSKKIERGLIEEFDSEDKVRAIVVLEGRLSGNLTRRMPKINKIQNRVLNKLNKKDFKILHQYKAVNALAIETNPMALKILDNHPEVKSVQEDKVFRPVLNESIPLIEADYVHSSLGIQGYTGEGQTVCIIDSGVDYTHPAIGGSGCSLTYDEEVLDTPVESPHPYPSEEGYEYVETITMPGYENIAVHFDNISIFKSKSHDSAYIEILDGKNKVVQIIKSEQYLGEPYCDTTSDFTSDYWSMIVPGDTIKIRLVSNVEYGCWGFNITKVREGSWNNCGDFLGGYDYVNSDDDPMDDNGHGTHVAGIITSDDSSYKGVAPDSKILAYKMLNDNGFGSGSGFIAGVDWCIVNKDIYDISVISVSLGQVGGQSPDYCDDEIDAEAVNDAVKFGIFVSVASGNDGHTDRISVPSCASNVTSVGSVKKNDKIAGYSNRASILDLLAPGGSGVEGLKSGICSTKSSEVPDTLRICDDLGNFIWKYGTSMACPHVSGLAALMLEADPSLTPIEIEEIMVNNAVSIDDPGSGLTFPRIDARAAVTEAMPDSVSITVSNSSLLFGDIDAGNYGTPEENPLIIEIVSSSNYEITAKSSSEYFTDESGDPTGLEDENLNWSNSSYSGPWTGYSMNETVIFKGVNSKSHYLFHKLMIPEEQEAGDYNLDLVFKVTTN
jgi:subtilisin family serine protease